MSHTPIAPRDLKLPAAFEILRNNQELNRMADTKASFLLVVHGMIVSSVIDHLSTLPAAQKVWPDLSRFLTGSLLVCLGAAIGCVFMVIMARSGSGDSARGRKACLSAGYVYFGHIAAMEMETYVRQATRLDSEDLLGDVLRQTHEVSSIGRRKYIFLGRAFGWSLAAFILWGAWIGTLMAGI